MDGRLLFIASTAGRKKPLTDRDVDQMLSELSREEMDEKLSAGRRALRVRLPHFSLACGKAPRLIPPYNSTRLPCICHGAIEAKAAGV